MNGLGFYTIAITEPLGGDLMWRVMTLIVLMTAVSQAYAVAFCSLRDPVQQIQQMYPGYTDFSSEIRDLKPSIALEYIQKSGLPIAVHAKEIGKHTLFYIQEGDNMSGIVHVRSEPGRWGLIEIAWSLSPEGTIQDFLFQRCRGGDCKNAETLAVKDQFKGLNVTSVGSLFNEAGEVIPQSLPIQQAFYETLVKSAAKTLVLTQAFWSVPQVMNDQGG
jgi:hypothetical protein